MQSLRCSAQSTGARTLWTLATALLLATSRQWLPATRGDEPPTGAQSRFYCRSGNRQLHVTANYSWQAVTVLAENHNFTGECSLYIDLPAHVNENQPAVTPSPQRQQQLSPFELLLKIDPVELALTADGSCDDARSSLNVFRHNRSWNNGYICNFSSVYIWTSDPIELYMYTTNKSSTAPSFSAAFIVVAELVNVCSSGSGSTELHIDRELYAFAPDSRYSDFPPNNVTCSNANYTLTFVANSSSSSLSVAVHTSPPSSSCCSLLLDGQRCGDGGTPSVGPSNRFTLLYSCDGCSDGNRPGFTLRVAVVSATTTSSQTTTASERATSQLTSASSPHSDTSNCSTATPPNTTAQPCSTRPLSATASSLGSSSSLSRALSATYATDAAPSSSTNCSPELLGVLPCSPYRSPNSSPSMSGNATNSSASDVTLVVAASVGTAVAVAIVVAVAAFAAKRRCRQKGEEAGCLQESGHCRPSAADPLPQQSPPHFSSIPAYQKALEITSADLHVTMVDNDLYVAM